MTTRRPAASKFAVGRGVIDIVGWGSGVAAGVGLAVNTGRGLGVGVGGMPSGSTCLWTYSYHSSCMSCTVLGHSLGPTADQHLPSSHSQKNMVPHVASSMLIPSHVASHPIVPG